MEYVGQRTIDDICPDFPIFGNRPGLAYLDSAATAQVPSAVLEAMMRFEVTQRANVHRGVYSLAEEATAMFEAARRTVADFIGAEQHEVSFVPSTTYGMHMVAEMLADRIGKGDGILVSSMEHHSALLPWRKVAEERGAMMTTVPHTTDWRLDMETLVVMLHDRVKVVVVTAASNVLGTVNPIADIVKLAHAKGALVVVDAAQYAPHLLMNVKEWGADVVVFSGHKLYGPMGVGVLYIADELGKTLTPAVQGGGMVRDVKRGANVWEDAPWKFEAGTQNVGAAIGLAAAMTYVDGIGRAAIAAREEELTRELIVGLLSFGDIAITGPDSMNDRIGVVSFTVPGCHPHDVATLLGADGVCIRAGHHCVQPLVEGIDVRGVCRVSIGLYTTREDIAQFVDSLRRARQTLV